MELKERIIEASNVKLVGQKQSWQLGLVIDVWSEGKGSPVGLKPYPVVSDGIAWKTVSESSWIVGYPTGNRNCLMVLRKLPHTGIGGRIVSEEQS